MRVLFVCELKPVSGIGGEPLGEIVRLGRIVPHRHAVAGHRPPVRRPPQFGGHRDHRIGFVGIVVGVEMILDT